MTFVHSRPTLAPGELWQNSYFNDLIVTLKAYLSSISTDPNDLQAPLTLSRQNLDGGGNAIYNFKHWGKISGAPAVILDACAYGAVGNNAGDDAPGIQAALDAIPSTGGIVILPPGIYRIKSALNMAGVSASNVILMGFGDSTIIRLTDDIPTTTCINFTGASAARSMMGLLNLKIDSIRAGGSAAVSAVSTALATNSFVEGVTISGVKGNGILVPAGADITIRKCRILNVTVSGVEIAALPPNFTSRVTVIGCRIDGGFLYGIKVNGAIRTKLISNRISSGQTNCTGIRIEGKDAMTITTGTSLIGNMITDCGDGVEVTVTV